MLHTRVSEQLSDDIRRFAEDLRVPASNLVRNVLEEVFTMVDSVSDDVGDLFDDLVDEAEGVRDRVRNQAASRKRSASRSSSMSRQRRRRSRYADDDDVETEFREDEARERGAARSNPRAGAAAADSAEAADASAAGEAADAAGKADETKPRAAELFPEILGWQPLVLNRDFECGRCSRALAAGESAFLGLGEGGLTQTALCGRCAGHR